MKSVDIVIVGGGMVGLALATQLADSPFSIALINQGQISKELTGIAEPRVSAINLASEAMLKGNGAWQHINHQRSNAYLKMDVWDKDSFGRIGFSHKETQFSHLGHIIENQNVVNGLYEIAKQQSNLTLLEDVHIKRLDLNEQMVLMHFSDDQLLSAKMVVGADGANSMVRKVAKLPISFWSYDQSAIVATVQTQEVHQRVARQAFMPTGPLAFLPLANDKQCSIVWSQDTESAQSLMALSDQDFNRHLATALNMQLGPCELLSKRHCIPLTMRYARQWLGQRSVIIGDAAHTIHPLAGQGVNLGFQDALSLANTLSEIDTELLGSKQVLRAFERERKAEAAKMVATMEGFKQLFAGNNPLKKLVRGAGLSLFDNLSPVKQALINNAMGL